MLEKISNTEKSSGRLLTNKRERTQINKIRSERGEIKTETTEIQRNLRDYYKQLYANKTENLEEIDNFLEMYSLPRKKQEIRTDQS